MATRTLNLCCLSLLRNLSGQSFVQEIRIGKAVGMTASGISFLPPIIPKAHEDLLSRSGRQHLLVSTGPQASPLSCTLLGRPRLVMQSRTPNLHLGIWKKYILMTKHWISGFVGKFWDKLLLIAVHGSSAVTTLQTVYAWLPISAHQSLHLFTPDHGWKPQNVTCMTYPLALS